MKTNIKPKITHSIIIDLLWTVLLSLGVASFCLWNENEHKTKGSGSFFVGFVLLGTTEFTLAPVSAVTFTTQCVSSGKIFFDTGAGPVQWMDFYSG